MAAPTGGGTISRKGLLLLLLLFLLGGIAIGWYLAGRKAPVPPASVASVKPAEEAATALSTEGSTQTTKSLESTSLPSSDQGDAGFEAETPPVSGKRQAESAIVPDRNSGRPATDLQPDRQRSETGFTGSSATGMARQLSPAVVTSPKQEAFPIGENATMTALPYTDLAEFPAQQKIYYAPELPFSSKSGTKFRLEGLALNVPGLGVKGGQAALAMEVPLGKKGFYLEPALGLRYMQGISLEYGTQANNRSAEEADSPGTVSGNFDPVLILLGDSSSPEPGRRVRLNDSRLAAISRLSIGKRFNGRLGLSTGLEFGYLFQRRSSKLNELDLQTGSFQEAPSELALRPIDLRARLAVDYRISPTLSLGAAFSHGLNERSAISGWSWKEDQLGISASWYFSN